MTAQPGRLQPLSSEQCLGYLVLTRVGRLCVIVEGTPLAFPVNYRLARSPLGEPVIVVRTHDRSVLDNAVGRVGFEIDGIEETTATGWSVLAEGTLHHGDEEEFAAWAPMLDPRPWPSGPHDVWLFLRPDRITGRELVGPTVEWAFHIKGYL